MIVNSRQQFIFLHIPKTGGRSIKRGLNRIPGNNKRWLADTNHETMAQFSANVKARLSLKDRFLWRNPKHYFSFAFVRNPWDRMSSLYRFLLEKRPKEETDTVSCFKDFLIQAQQGVTWIQELKSMKSQLDYFTMPGGRMKIGFLGHFEFLNDDVNSISKHIKCSISLGHENRSTNFSSDYQRYFDNEMIEIVASRFSEEIEPFGYTFERKQPSRRCSEHLDCYRETFRNSVIADSSQKNAA